jgi:hypothetical protein
VSDPIPPVLIVAVSGRLAESGAPLVEALAVGAADPGQGGGQNEVTRLEMVTLVAPLMTAEG